MEALGTIGVLGFLACLVWLIVAAVRKRPKKNILIGLLITFVAFAVGVSNSTTSSAPASASGVSSDPSSSTAQPNAAASKLATSEQASSESITDGATKVDYKTLYKDYENNAISADKKYRDKKLVLTGTIANIDRDIGQSPYITFNVDQYGMQSIKMSFDSDDTVAALKKGQKVTVVGTCDGSFAGTIITLSDCEIVK